MAGNSKFTWVKANTRVPRFLILLLRGLQKCTDCLETTKHEKPTVTYETTNKTN
jgi:hypothetical protein